MARPPAGHLRLARVLAKHGLEPKAAVRVVLSWDEMIRDGSLAASRLLPELATPG